MKERPKRGPVVSTRDALSEQEAAFRCGVSYKTMTRYRQKRIGPPFLQAGGKQKRVVYPAKALDAWIAANLSQCALISEAERPCAR